MQASTFLRENTRDAHRATEKSAQSHLIMSGTITTADYTAMMAANYKVWSGVHTALKQYQATTGTTAWIRHLAPMVDHLEKDLQMLSLSPPKNQTPTSLLINSDQAALGACYVLFGSLLGGVHIYRALQKNASVEALGALHFYEACSQSDRSKWQSFQQQLDEYLYTPARQQAAANTAKSVFLLFQEAYTRAFQHSSTHE